MRSLQVMTTSALAVVLTASIALANAGGGSAPAPPRPATPGAEGRLQQGGEQKSEAEQYYGYAYEEIAKAKQDLEKNNEKKAKKRLEKAFKWSERAVEFEPKYHEAWNLVGYTARKLGNYERSIEAYETCLDLQPTYVPAREYLGEALVEMGNLKDARMQVAWLERLNASDEAAALLARIEAVEGEAAEAGKSAAEVKANGTK